jgi:hypothetical protein
LGVPDKRAGADSMPAADLDVPGPAACAQVPVHPDSAVVATAEAAINAERWAEERGLRAGDELDYPREPEYLVLARVLLAQDLPGQALSLLERMRATAVAQARTGSIIESSA